MIDVRFWLDYIKIVTVLIKNPNFDQLKVRKIDFEDRKSIFVGEFFSRKQSKIELLGITLVKLEPQQTMISEFLKPC